VTIYTGSYGDQAVAVKLYRNDARFQAAERTGGQWVSTGSETSGIDTMGSTVGKTGTGILVRDPLVHYMHVKLYAKNSNHVVA